MMPIFLCGNCSARAKVRTQFLEKEMLQISIECIGQIDCEYSGNDLPIRIMIKNTSAAKVKFPLKFLQKTGPIIRLINLNTMAETFLRTNPADFKLKESFTVIEPQNVVRIDWVIHKFEVETHGIEKSSLAAEVIITAKIQVDGEITEFQGSSRLHIAKPKN